MLSEVFYWILNMGIAATITGSVVLVLRIFKKIPRRLIFLLWVIPFVHMWVPVGLASEYGLMSLISKINAKTVVVYENIKTFTMMNCITAADGYFPIIYKVDVLEKIFSVISIIWIGVAAVILIIWLTVYISTKIEMRDVIHLKDNIWISEKAVTPAVYGVFSPKIIIPQEYKEKDLTYIIAHENAHIQHRDNLFRIIAFITVTIHWFNPFAWIFLKSFLTDMELACDERVLSKYGEGEKKDYASALVDSAEHKSVFVSAFGGAKIRMRIDNILSYKKITVLSAVCFTLMVITIFYVLLTNAY